MHLSSQWWVRTWEIILLSADTDLVHTTYIGCWVQLEFNDKQDNRSFIFKDMDKLKVKGLLKWPNQMLSLSRSDHM